jgi:DNA mismatch endonuclease, patch repair protein
MDNLTPSERSVRMSQIRSKHTQPELRVRGLVHRLGYRFRLHRKDLPGAPDMVFPGRKKVVFVHGCFWHCHSRCNVSHLPKTRRAYWRDKLVGNVERDKANRRRLRQSGWSVLIVWECETRDIEKLRNRVRTFLDNLHS